MDLNLKGKIALVGGSSKGLGKGCALQLAREGANVVICARGMDKLTQTAEFIKESSGSEVLPIQADLSRPEDIIRVVDETINKFGRIDILVNNSGGPRPGKFFDFSDQDWEDAFNQVLLNVIRMCRHVIPHMKNQKSGRIINVTSLTVKEPADTLILSNVFRTGVVSLAKTLSRELIEHNITINNVCPGAFKTDRAIDLMLNESRKTNTPLEEIEQKSVSNLPLKRFQTPEELGDFVAFLASDQAKGITGTTIQVDGGICRSLF